MLSLIDQLSSLAEVFILIIPGVILAKTKILSEDQANGISQVVVNIAWPCLVISVLQMDSSPRIIINAGLVVLASCILTAIAFLMGSAVLKFHPVEDSKKYLFLYMLIFANTGFMGIPIAKAVLGNEGVIYIALADSLTDIFVFTVGVFLMSKATGSSSKSSPKEMISPGSVSIVIGLILFLTGFRLPAIIEGPIDAIGAVTTPLSMLIVGYNLGKINIKSLVTGSDVYILAFSKLVLLPAIVFIILKTSFGLDDTFLKVILLISALPSATCTILFAEKYQADTAYATRGVVLTTLLSLISLTVFTTLMHI